MPCWQSRTISLDLSSAVKVGKDIVVSALKEEGWAVHPADHNVMYNGRNTINIVTGESFFRDEDVASEVKKAIAKKALQVKAKQFGWSVVTKADGTLTMMKGKL